MKYKKREWEEYERLQFTGLDDTDLIRIKEDCIEEGQPKNTGFVAEINRELRIRRREKLYEITNPEA